MTTNTLDTTRLSEEQLRKTLGMITRWCRNDLGYLEPFAASQVELLQRHIDTLAADLARVGGERDRYREALEEIDRIAAPYIAEAGFDSIAGLAFAALNGGTDAE